MAHKKAQGSTQNNRDSKAKRLGLKRGNGELVKAGQILIRQRGSKYHPGKNVKQGKDDTLYATADGIVKFLKKQKPNFHGALKKRTFVEVVSK